MVELIREDHIFLAHQGRDGGQVGCKARLEGDGCLNALESGQAAFKLQMDIHGACNGTHGARAFSVVIQGLLGGGDHFGVVSQAKIVVRTEIEDFLSIHGQPGSLWGAQCADPVVQAGFF
ncbi:hypothetical protein SDC9_177012 [bioreactor metagenome]|uniref:Uncharacterized protein n=1 Tax=bioreactor metagenome TaxID=1076179 RepID=A0A645GUX8_9ZZZZ